MCFNHLHPNGQRVTVSQDSAWGWLMVWTGSTLSSPVAPNPSCTFRITWAGFQSDTDAWSPSQANKHQIHGCTVSFLEYPGDSMYSLVEDYQDGPAFLHLSCRYSEYFIPDPEEQ